MHDTVRGTNPLPLFYPNTGPLTDDRQLKNTVRYNPGNLGDLLKHGWLVEIVRFLHRQKSGQPIRYADSFCGFAEYDIDEELARRIRDRFHVLTFRHLQEPFLSRGKYAGSVTLARLAADGEFRIPRSAAPL